MADFHFIRPYWLFALIGLIFALWLVARLRVNNTAWQKLLPAHLAEVLIKQPAKSTSLSLLAPTLIGFLTIIALAGPTWQKLPQPVYQIARGSVLVMDMSYSMLATDVSPNRLTRARYKAIDLLDNINEGDIGLIAYAGDAFTISPLTTDINNIKLLLPSLSPDIMPELGSNPYAALALADDMLKNAGHLRGDIYWFTDGVDNEELTDLHELAQKLGHKVNILGIGTKAGAPIKLTNGELLKDDNGAIVIPKLPSAKLAGIARSGKGNYHTISLDNSDIEKLVSGSVLDSTKDQSEDQNSQQQDTDNQSNTGDQWQEAGPYLLLLVLPLVLSYFRRGQLFSLILPSLTTGLSSLVALSIGLAPTPSQANTLQDAWTDLWQTQDQQAQEKFGAKAYQEAAEQFADSQWRASAHYKAGNYEQALSGFQQSNSADALYNQGNALAKLGRIDEAIDAYQQALNKQPDFANAKANKELLEALKKQQEQQNQQDSKGDNNQEQNQQKNGDNAGDNSDGNNTENANSDNSSQENSDSENTGQDDSEQGADSGEQQGAEQSDNSNQSNNSQSNKSELDTPKDNSQQPAESGSESNQEQSSEQTASDAMQQPDAQQPGEQGQTAAIDQASLAEQQDQEAAQKHQQILKKVTDDPYLLLRNKMQLEYQKRRHNNNGAKKKW